MKNTLTLNHNNRTIVMDRTFAKNAMNTMSQEYTHLQRVRQDYPNYQVVQKHIKVNDTKETYKGLTYNYMREYIKSHEETEETLKELEEQILISKCHGTAFRYPCVKQWFLNKYPEIAKFGQLIEKNNEEQTADGKQCAQLIKSTLEPTAIVA